MTEHIKYILKLITSTLSRPYNYIHRRTIQLARLAYTLHIFFRLNSFFKHAHPTLKKHRFRIALLKYIRNYLSRPLDSAARATILMHHYRFILANTTDQFINGVMSDCILLWQDEDRRYRVTLAYPRKDQEGDLSLEFLHAGTPLCNLSFTFIPGHNTNKTNNTMLFISRLQGTSGQFSAIREATQYLNDVSLFTILFTATQAISATMDICIGAITAQDQTVVSNMQEGSFHTHRYDAMWESLGGTKTDDAIYLLPTEPINRKLTSSSKKHKSKRIRQRSLKMSIFNTTVESITPYCVRLKRLNGTSSH